MENDDIDGRPLQDAFQVQCFGCGALNAQGLQIKSHWEGDELVCRWRPQPFHIGHPGVVYGGIIASVIDCHAMWAAMATACREEGVAVADGPPPFVTGRLDVRYLKPARIDEPLEVRAQVVDGAGRKRNVRCRVLQQGVECATAEVVAVRLEAMP